MKESFIPVILFLSLLITIPADAQMVTYSGPVEYHFEIIKTSNGGGADKGYNWNVSVNEKQIIQGSFYVTFMGQINRAGPDRSGFSLTAIEEDLQYVNSVNNEGSEQKISQPCYDDRLVFKHNAKPGDSRTERLAVQSARTNPGKALIESGNIMFRDNKYTMMLMGKMKINVTSETYSSITLPCLDTIIPPQSISSNTTLDFPVVIYAEKLFSNPDLLEGTFYQKNETSDDCRLCLGGMGRMAHGDMNCSYISNITTSWTLVKRTKECDATISYLKGDVKINGASEKQGSIKVGAGDMIKTGEKSGIELRIGNSTYRMGSKSKLLLTDPCELKTRVIKDPHSAGLTFIRGKIRVLIDKTVGIHPDFDPNMRTTASGVRGHISPIVPLLYASADPDFVPCVVHYMDTLTWLPAAQQDDPEKAELIAGYQSLPNNTSAYYLDFKDGVVLDLTALKGTIHVRDDLGLRTMDILEGTTVNRWQDGTQMTEIIIMTK